MDKTAKFLISLLRRIFKPTLLMKSYRSSKKELTPFAQCINLYPERESESRPYGETKTGSDCIPYLIILKSNNNIIRFLLDWLIIYWIGWLSQYSLFSLKSIKSMSWILKFFLFFKLCRVVFPLLLMVIGYPLKWMKAVQNLNDLICPFDFGL